MLNPPPFRPALLPSAAAWLGESDIPFGDAGTTAPADVEPAAGTRLRLREMDTHLHCSVIGTCLSTTELRKLMGRFIDVDKASDLDVHHEAVRLAAQNPEVSRALNRALDRRHEGSVQRFAPAKDASDLGRLWKQSLQSGDVPGAYWAVLTHRRTTLDLRQQVFGDVHMLSHLVGAANRADIRRLVSLERENAELRDRAERQQERMAEVLAERERGCAERDELRARIAELERIVQSAADGSRTAREAAAATAALSSAVALQTRRREAAEMQVASLHSDVRRLEEEAEHLRLHTVELGHELAAAEAELRNGSDLDDAAASALRGSLAGRRVLYVGGRPSSNAAIRDLVLRHGGDYQRHDGGIEDRKGLLAAALAWADLVVFPVDCVDHDSAQGLKRSCVRQGTSFLPLRSASVASFAAAVRAMAQPPSHRGPSCGCLRHG
jgi:hypothetical protein